MTFSKYYRVEESNSPGRPVIYVLIGIRLMEFKKYVCGVIPKKDLFILTLMDLVFKYNTKIQIIRLKKEKLHLFCELH